MNVTIVVIALNEERNITTLLDSLSEQQYSADFEVLVVDGGSQDTTQKLVEEHKDKRVALIVDSKGTITHSRNEGVKHARYDYVAFIDADCIAPKDWLKRLTDGYKRRCGESKVAAVGGANIPPLRCSSFVKAIGIAFDSFVGSLGSIQAKPFPKDKSVPSVSCSNAFYNKKALNAVGGFSEDLGNQGEDWEVGYKLRKKGYSLYGLGGCFVWHNLRSTPASFWKNMVFYGDGRMRLTKKHPSGFRWVYGLPFVFGLVMGSSVLSFLWKGFLLPLLYFPLIFLYSLYLSFLKKKLYLFLHVFLVFVILHFGYAWGMIKGLRWLFK